MIANSVCTFLLLLLLESTVRRRFRISFTVLFIFLFHFRSFFFDIHLSATYAIFRPVCECVCFRGCLMTFVFYCCCLFLFFRLFVIIFVVIFFFFSKVIIRCFDFWIYAYIHKSDRSNFSNILCELDSIV